MNRTYKNILVTGGAGFIGSHLVRRLVKMYGDSNIICFDSLTYAGNLANLSDVEGRENYRFEKGDITDLDRVRRLFKQYEIDGVIHLAAESHVDRSIDDPFVFARTNVMGTLTLLQAAREAWNGDWSGKMFHHVSTDEVFGSLDVNGYGRFTESTPYAPHSPYSASKASSDHFVRAFHDTYGLPVVITNCSNNYGPFQFPEKLIPLCINNILGRREIPVYGTGENVRDWLYVEDHAEALDLVFHSGRVGETYAIGGDNEWRNIDLVRELIAVTDRLTGRAKGEDDGLIRFVADRAGHDLRYAIDSSKICSELGWKPRTSFREGLERTVRWYMNNSKWRDGVLSGEYTSYYRKMYSGR